MKKLLFLLLFIPFLGTSQGTFTAPVGYNTGAPTAAPSGVGTRWRFDLLTGKKYTWNPDAMAWDEDPRGIDQISGCSAPLYTPGYNQSTFAVNSCSPVPELYQYTGSAWVKLNSGGSYTAGTGIDITSGVISNTIARLLIQDEGTSLTDPILRLNFVGDAVGANTAFGSQTATVTFDSDINALANNANNGFLVRTGPSTSGITARSIIAGTGIGVTNTTGSGGNPVISNTAPDQTVVLNAGTGIGVTGTYPNFTIANSAPNVTQTLSISGSDLTLSDGGGTVTLPGGSITWPMLAPDGDASAPSYSFASLSQSGLWMGSKAMTLSSSQTAIEISTGNQSDEGITGSGITIKGGSAVSGEGGTIIITGGESEQVNGGGVNVAAGNGFLQGGNFSLSAGNASGGTGGNFDMLAGASSSGPGGQFNIVAGNGSVTGGNIVMTPGAGPTDADAGKVIVATCAGVVFPKLTSSQLSSIVPEAGQTVFCTDATANDSSTGVLKTYNGSTWKNHW